jgi:redox-sensitive bicupin YhaK (pirin superfamily)
MTSSQGLPQPRVRHVVYRTRGYALGPITRLVSPSDVGELIKPFVFLDYFDIEPRRAPAFGFHPHSGIATLTLVLEGRVSYEETSGTKGTIEPGGVEWMRAARGVWHTGGVAGTARASGYQLWIALPPEMETIESEAQYLGTEHFQADGPARVILGRYGEAASKVRAPTTINYLEVALKKRERWRYQPPERHNVAWVRVHRGKLATPEIVERGELAVFEELNAPVEFEALEDTGFILGSAVKHPYDLVLGSYSVHTSIKALQAGEAEIRRIANRLRAEGRLQEGIEL